MTYLTTAASVARQWSVGATDDCHHRCAAAAAPRRAAPRRYKLKEHWYSRPRPVGSPASRPGAGCSAAVADAAVSLGATWRQLCSTSSTVNRQFHDIRRRLTTTLSNARTIDRSGVQSHNGRGQSSRASELSGTSKFSKKMLRAFPAGQYARHTPHCNSTFSVVETIDLKALLSHPKCVKTHSGNIESSITLQKKFRFAKWRGMERAEMEGLDWWGGRKRGRFPNQIWLRAVKYCFSWRHWLDPAGSWLVDMTCADRRRILSQRSDRSRYSTSWRDDWCARCDLCTAICHSELWILRITHAALHHTAANFTNQPSISEKWNSHYSLE